MLNYVLRKILYGIPILLGVVTLLFLLFRFVQSDPARAILGQRADEEAVNNLNKIMGLDQPKWIQYFNYLNQLSPLGISKTQSGCWACFAINKNQFFGIKQPDLGYSYFSGKSVNEIISDRMPATLLLALSAIAIAFVVGVIFGLISALFDKTAIDYFFITLSTLGMAIPGFLLAILVMWFFGNEMNAVFHLNRVGSLYAYDSLGRGSYLELKNLILPAFTLGIRPIAVIMQLTKSAALDVLNAEFVKTAKAKGLSKNYIIRSHVIKNVLNPVITAASGWLAGMLAGSVFVEWVFGWKGLGSEMVFALENFDFPALTGIIIVIASSFVILNILVDIIYALIDPRIQYN
jgi:peptide/nickel transport system permease protein